MLHTVTTALGTLCQSVTTLSMKSEDLTFDVAKALRCLLCFKGITFKTFHNQPCMYLVYLKKKDDFSVFLGYCEVMCCALAALAVKG